MSELPDPNEEQPFLTPNPVPDQPVIPLPPPSPYAPSSTSPYQVNPYAPNPGTSFPPPPGGGNGSFPPPPQPYQGGGSSASAGKIIAIVVGAIVALGVIGLVLFAVLAGAALNGINQGLSGVGGANPEQLATNSMDAFAQDVYNLRHSNPDISWDEAVKTISETNKASAQTTNYFIVVDSVNDNTLVLVGTSDPVSCFRRSYLLPSLSSAPSSPVTSVPCPAAINDMWNQVATQDPNGVPTDNPSPDSTAYNATSLKAATQAATDYIASINDQLSQGLDFESAANDAVSDGSTEFQTYVATTTPTSAVVNSENTSGICYDFKVTYNENNNEATMGKLAKATCVSQ